MIDTTNLRCPICGTKASRVWGKNWWRCEKFHYLAHDVTKHGAVINPT